MNLPRNAYTRYNARRSGRARAAYQQAKGTVGAGDHLEVAYAGRALAYRWQGAWWCSVPAGRFVESGEMTLRAFVADFWLTLLPVATIAGLALAIFLAGMAVGEWAGRTP